MHKQILEEEEIKKKIQSDIRTLTERLSQISESLTSKMATRNDFDKTIAETETAYKKVSLLVSIILISTHVRLSQQISMLTFAQEQSTRPMQNIVRSVMCGGGGEKSILFYLAAKA